MKAKKTNAIKNLVNLFVSKGVLVSLLSIGLSANAQTKLTFKEDRQTSDSESIELNFIKVRELNDPYFELHYLLYDVYLTKSYIHQGTGKLIVSKKQIGHESACQSVHNEQKQLVSFTCGLGNGGGFSDSIILHIIKNENDSLRAYYTIGKWNKERTNITFHDEPIANNLTLVESSDLIY